MVSRACLPAGRPDEGILARMIAALRHRGPDDEGTFLDPHAALGHRRLSIIDLEGSHQPMTDETGGLHLICNGEIYNYRELRQELLARGHRFTTKGDSEVILHLYQEMGERCVEPLNGMFAFAIWDAKGGSLLLARDRIGIKPLYYVQLGDALLFASELKALLAHPGLRREIDPDSLDLYLTFRYVPAPRTILRNIFKLLPGHTLRWEVGSASAGKQPLLRKYWDLPDAGAARQDLGRRGAVEELENLLSDSVRIQRVSDVPLGAYLSGGLDSSLLAALMARSQQQPVNTFSVGFAERGFDERSHARRVAHFLHTHHRELICLQEPSLRELPRILWFLDEPVADAAAIPTFQMAHLTKEHVTVVLTGEGADELFAGYPYYKFYTWTDRLRGGLRPLGFAAPGRLGAYLASIRDRAQAYLALKSVFTAQERASLCAPPLADALRPSLAVEVVEEHLGRGRPGDYLRQLLRLDLKLWLPDDLLVKVDRMTMAHAVEARVPYLDHRVVEFMFRLPSSLKLHGLAGKHLLRRLGARLLPKSTARRPKRGFVVPVAKWLRDRTVASSILSPESIMKRGLFRVEPVQRLVQLRRLNLFARRQLWSLLCLELWCRMFLDRDPTQPPAEGEGALR